MVLSNKLIKSTLDEWITLQEKKDAKSKSYRQTIGYQWASFINNNGWTHTATIRPYRFPLTETRSYDLISRLMEYKKFNKVFYTLEKDTTGMNHCHILMDTNYTDPVMNNIRWEMNTMLGQKYNSGMVQYVDEIRTEKGITKYVTKHIKSNGVYNLLA